MYLLTKTRVTPHRDELKQCELAQASIGEWLVSVLWRWIRTSKPEGLNQLVELRLVSVSLATARGSDV
jgi:hypothetical protein